MVKLLCAIVGADCIVAVDISPQQAIADLKDQIKKKAGFDFPSDKLALYLAKQNDNRNGAWVAAVPPHPDYAPLLRGDQGVKPRYLTTTLLLDPTASVEDHFTGAPKKNVIHVLVKMPHARSPSITLPVESSPHLEQSSNASVVGSSSWWPFSYLPQLWPNTSSESKKYR